MRLTPGARPSAPWRAAPILALSLAGCGLAGAAQQSNGAGAPTAAPAISATTLGGTAFTLASWHGHPVVIDFWGSWCGPCRAEQSDINKLVRSFSARGVEFVGVDMRDDDAAALAYRRNLGVTYDSVPDSGEQISAAYNVTAPPTIVLVDQQGRIVDRFLGTVVGLGDELSHLL